VIRDPAARAFSFGEIAEDYDRYRPGPPSEAARWVLGHGRGTVVDLGAGTGALTRALLSSCGAVIAVEPDPRMGGVLSLHAGGAAVVRAVGERLPFADGSVDGVVAASSWQWMDPVLAGAEVARVLRVGGTFGLLWSGPDRRVPWVADLFGRRSAPPVGDDTDHRARRAMMLAASLPFSEPETTVIWTRRTISLDDLAGLAGTYSVVIVAGQSERQARMDLVRDRARSVFGQGPVELPMACRCWRAFRTEGPVPSP